MDLTFFATLSAFAIAIIGANYKFVNDIKDDLRSDIEKMEKRWEKSDERWVTLLKEMHYLDKAVDRLENNK